MFFSKQKPDKYISKFFEEENLKISAVRGFMEGMQISPLAEEEIIEYARVDADRVNRKKILVKVIDILEKQKAGKGRKFMNLAGFQSIEEME